MTKRIKTRSGWILNNKEIKKICFYLRKKLLVTKY